MQVRLILSGAAVVFALAVGSTSIVLGQASQLLSEKDAKQLLKQSQKNLEQARKASQRGEATAIADHTALYSANLQQLNHALSSGHVKEEDVLDVAARVDEATLKHVPILEGLLGTVPAEAQPAIERALAVSRTGHDTATTAILHRGAVSLPDGVLTDRVARDAMDRNEALVRHAERARKRGDSSTVDRSVGQYTANIELVGRAIEEGAVDESEALSVYDRVDRNTRRHVSVLEGLLGRVPEEARPAIERAIQVSQRGHQAASAAISRTPAAGIAAGGPGVAGPPAGIGGRQGGVGGGRPGGGGPPASPPRPSGPPH